ncbi:Uncharacterised protein [Mycobacterium tuberculosis]|uniref:Uncharacterized protein n=1 Tax=Mycobacterium tuberculosis TaxID=1773 RepID=A0A916P8D0_MYCTX|nr:Uncharacterised protein [Mycobacterium tuberculosis]
MASTPAAFGIPDAVTAGKRASRAAIRSLDGSNRALMVEPRCCTLPRSRTVMKSMTAALPGSAMSVISSSEERTEMACSTISLEFDSRSSRASRSMAGPRPKARVPANGSVITTPSARTAVTSSGL